MNSRTEEITRKLKNQFTFKRIKGTPGNYILNNSDNFGSPIINSLILITTRFSGHTIQPFLNIEKKTFVHFLQSNGGCFTNHWIRMKDLGSKIFTDTIVPGNSYCINCTDSKVITCIEAVPVKQVDQ